MCGASPSPLPVGLVGLSHSSMIGTLQRGLQQTTAVRWQSAMPQRASSLATGFAARALLPPVRPASSALIARAVSSRSCMSHALTRGSCKPTTAKVGPISQQLVASTSHRLLSSTNGGNSGGGGAGGFSGNVTLVAQALSWANQNRSVVGVVAAATVVMYGFYRGSMYVMHFFFNVSDKQIFEIGFACGILATLAIAGTGVYANRYLSVSTSQVYRAALARLRTHGAVNDKLGEFWRSSGFRGYKVESLADAFQGSERRARSSYLEAPSRRVQMIFMVKGIERSGMVSCQAHKRGGDYIFDMLALDLLPTSDGKKPAEHVFLEGNADQILFSELGLLLDSTRASGRSEAKMED